MNEFSFLDMLAMMTFLGQIFQTRYDLWKGNTCTEGQTLQYFGYFNSEVYSYIPDQVITLNVFYYLENIKMGISFGLLLMTMIDTSVTNGKVSGFV